LIDVVRRLLPDARGRGYRAVLAERQHERG
jgi:hypothetical protein